MPRKAAGTIKTDRYKETKSNGIVYVYERSRKYNPEKRYNENLGTKLLGILKPGADDIYNDENLMTTRPRRRKVPDISPTHKGRTGMIDIIKHFSVLSGIENDLSAALPGEEGIAQKLLTCAWFLFSTDGDSMPKIRSWSKKYEGLLPYRHGIITKDIYHNLFHELGHREEIKQAIFRERSKSLGEGAVLALDSSTFEVESAQQAVGRKAVHKDKLIKTVYKIVNFYSLDERRPIAFSLIPGNIPDAGSVRNGLAQLKALQLKNIEIISDNGYCSDSAIAELLLDGQHFITRVRADIKWIQPLVSRHRRTLEHGGGIIECDPLFSGIQTTACRTFTAKDGRTIEKTVNVFIYFSSVNKSKDDVFFRETFHRYRHTLIHDIAQCDERKEIESFSKRYMIIERDKNGKIISVKPNKKSYDEHMKYNGFLVLIADRESDLDMALKKFREREYIEEDIKNYKGHTGGRKARVWDADTLEGQILAQFLALTLHESFESRIRFLKDTLAKPNGDAEHDKEASLKIEKQLYNWLFKNSLFDILHWFDAIVTTTVEHDNQKTTWITETTQRDKLFLEKIGIKTVSRDIEESVPEEMLDTL